ncbi:MAG: DUF1993 domain-containing protein [Myxococcales bacterium]|nr:DUF1993 domain-containing protein [Myxococcales bacterium]
MAISLYDTSVVIYQQILASISGVLDKGKAHAKATGIDLSELVETRLIEDMAPLRFQIISTAHHSLGAIEGLRAGVFGTPPQHPELDYDGLHGLITNALETLADVSPDDINKLEGNDMRFEFGDFKIPFTAEGFVQSFSLPNFFFHATTTYDILRMKGVEIGKMDFLGKMRVKGA